MDHPKPPDKEQGIPYDNQFSSQVQETNMWNSKNFKMEATNIFWARHYDINDAEKVAIIKNSLGMEGFQFIKTLTTGEQESCENV